MGKLAEQPADNDGISVDALCQPLRFCPSFAGPGKQRQNMDRHRKLTISRHKINCNNYSYREEACQIYGANGNGAIRRERYIPRSRAPVENRPLLTELDTFLFPSALQTGRS